MTTLKNSDTKEMEREVGLHLHDDLVEKIITMMPFPAIFKARCLSKTWQARLSSFAAQDEEAKRCLVPSFHRQVFERRITWDTSWSIFVRRGSFFGYDQASHSFRTMPSLSFLPGDEVFESGVPLPGRTMFESTRMQIEGPVLFTCRLEARHSKCMLYLANILTKSWRRLQLPPRLTDQIFYQKLLIDKSGKAYKVILLGHREMDYDVGPPSRTTVSIQIYDSKSNAWKIDFFQDLQWRHCPSTAAHHNGVLYIAFCEGAQHLLAYNLEDGTLQQLSLDFRRVGGRGWGGNFSIQGVKLLTHKTELLMVVTTWHGCRWRLKTLTKVLRIDLEAGTLLWLAGTGAIEGRRTYTECVMDGGCIILGMEDLRSRRMLQYNLDSKEWSHFWFPIGGYEWLGSCFQPSVNPFMVV